MQKAIVPFLLCVWSTGVAFGQTADDPRMADATARRRAVVQCRSEVQVVVTREAELIELRSEEFVKLGFGTGYGAVISVDDRPRVEEAELVGGVVRVTKDNDVAFGPILELHKFFGIGGKKLVRDPEVSFLAGPGSGCARSLLPKTDVPLVGFGPFVGLRIGGDEVVQSFAAGIMFGFRKADGDKSLNLGVAYATDPRVRTLGDGIEEGKALPAGETEIRFKNTHQESVIVMFSIGW